MGADSENGEPTPTEWNAQLKAKRLSALDDLRSSASSWAGSLATALGAVSLSAVLTGSKTFSGLATASAHWGEGTFIAAAVLALAATALALYTAQQTKLSKFKKDQQTSYAEWSVKQVTDGFKRLHRSQFLAALAATMALVSAGFLFFGTQAPSTPTTVDVGGTTLCKAGTTTVAKPTSGTGYAIECQK